MHTSPDTVEAKYIYLDIVNYTQRRSVEAQTEIITVLNRIVKESVAAKAIDEHVIYIPTGDGICIAIINVFTPIDIHIEIALTILEKLSVYNGSVNDMMRKFSVRTGINENIDNLITDINENKNISGSGINTAARILTLCDENQILVGDTVYDKLMQREKYMKAFVSYLGTIKHGVALKVHQYKNDSLPFLNSEVPIIFRSKLEVETEFSDLVGYYIAHCIINADFIDKNLKQPQSKYSLTVLMFYLAQDSLEKSQETKTQPTSIFTKRVRKNLQLEFNNMQSAKFWIICDLSSFIVKERLNEFKKYFSDGFLFVNQEGRNKLKKDCPAIFKKFQIDKH